MDTLAAQLPLPGIGTTPPNLDVYVVGARRERRPVADVYDAVHRFSGVPYVVFVLRPGAMQDRALVHRIGCEVDAARWIRHTAVPRLDPPGETPSRRLYVAVEHRPAPTLRRVIAERGSLPAQEVVRLGGSLVDALEEAHALGLVHGRFTPDAVGIADDGPECGAPRVILTGLGLGTVAQCGEFAAGERAFVSPEQLEGCEPDVRSDVFGFAAVLDYAMHGEAGATGGSPAARASVAGVLRAGRSTNPRDRQPSVRALWEELLGALVAAASSAEAARGAAAAGGAVLSAPMPATRRRRAARAYTWWLALPMAAALGWPLARGGAHPPTPTPAPTQVVSGEVALPGVRAVAPPPATAPTPYGAAQPTADAHATGTREGSASSAARLPATSSDVEQPSAKPDAQDTHVSPSALPRVDVPTFVIINAEPVSPRTAARTGEFGDGLPRPRGTP